MVLPNDRPNGVTRRQPVKGSLWLRCTDLFSAHWRVESVCVRVCVCVCVCEREYVCMHFCTCVHDQCMYLVLRCSTACVRVVVCMCACVVCVCMCTCGCVWEREVGGIVLLQQIWKINTSEINDALFGQWCLKRKRKKSEPDSSLPVLFHTHTLTCTIYNMKYIWYWSQ